MTVSPFDLANRLEAWAHNEEMVDSGFTVHGHDCNEAAKLLRSAVVEFGRLRALLVQRGKLSSNDPQQFPWR